MELLVSKNSAFINIEQYNASKAWNHKIDCICVVCGEDFTVTRQGLQKRLRKHGIISCTGFCTKKYKGTAHDKVKTKCAECKKDLWKSRSDWLKTENSFCNHTCSARYNNVGVRRHGTAPDFCLWCETRLPNSKAKYCDTDCQSAYEQATYFAEIEESGNANPRGNKHIPSVAKRYLIHTRGHSCEVCQNTQWMGLPIPLVLDHIDGNPEDHALTNLRLVCGNCDMQLPTYKSKNKGNGRHNRRKRYAEGKSY